MKLTENQMKVVSRMKKLEEEHGKGNVFIRYINDYRKACFIIHKIGMDTFNVKLISKNKINGWVLNSLTAKGLVTVCDNYHNEDVDPNEWRNQPEGWFCVSSRIKTELIEEE